MVDLKKSSQNILVKKLEEYIQQGRTKFYLREIVEDARVSLVEAEDFFIPLLKHNEIEGSLEIRCPNCGAELGAYKKYPDIPEELECELCETTFPKSYDYFEVVLEVMGKFFRAKIPAFTTA